MCIWEHGPEFVDDRPPALAGCLAQLEGAPFGEDQLPFQVHAEGEHAQHIQEGGQHRPRLIHGRAALAGIAGKTDLSPLPQLRHAQKCQLRVTIGGGEGPNALEHQGIACPGWVNRQGQVAAMLGAEEGYPFAMRCRNGLAGSGRQPRPPGPGVPPSGAPGPHPSSPGVRPLSAPDAAVAGGRGGTSCTSLLVAAPAIA